jgi:hypothetical protein
VRRTDGDLNTTYAYRQDHDWAQHRDRDRWVRGHGDSSDGQGCSDRGRTQWRQDWRHAQHQGSGYDAQDYRGAWGEGGARDCHQPAVRNADAIHKVGPRGNAVAQPQSDSQSMVHDGELSTTRPPSTTIES